ncbi:MAG: YlmC/YmxH family sporulation protein [Clostridia bacterium]|nr:YlmC/YmxH family sporulation protein [Clostridia bacterium]
MERFSTCELREKEVINLCDGTRLGCPCDFEFNVYEGVITAIIIPRPSGFLGLSRANDLVIPWERIECIGTDAILVRMPSDERNVPYKDRNASKQL